MSRVSEETVGSRKRTQRAAHSIVVTKHGYVSIRVSILSAVLSFPDSQRRGALVQTYAFAFLISL